MRDILLYLSTIPDYNQMLAGKNVLITTAARGIGKSIAQLFARQGADVYFGGRNEEYVRTTEKELQLIRPGCRSGTQQRPWHIAAEHRTVRPL